MPKVTFIDYDGSVRAGETPVGESLMRAAVALEVRGVLAECGGLCSCATCHCYVDPEWVSKLEPPSDAEQAMLEGAWEPSANSRLSCQLIVRPDLDGIVLRVPARQI